MASITQAASSTPLPTEIASTHVTVKDSSGAERLAPLFFVSPTQINYQVPPGAQSGPALVTVFNGSGSSATEAIQIVDVAPGLFTANATGSGVAAALALRVKADGTQIYESIATFDHAQNQFVAAPIDLGAPTDQVFLVLFGTGLRGRSALSAVTATVGGTSAEVFFAGAHGSLVGLDQVNLLLPRGVTGMGPVDVAINVDGLMANVVKINVK